MKSPQEECEDLMNSVLPFAKLMLRKEREFFPYGGAMTPDGQMIDVGADTGDEHPASKEVLAVLEKGFQDAAKTGKYKATAIVVDMLVVPPGKSAKQDAIAVRLDHRDGFSAIVFFPYVLGSDGALAVEAPFAVKGEQRIFPH